MASRKPQLAHCLYVLMFLKIIFPKHTSFKMPYKRHLLMVAACVNRAIICLRN